jgi:hypothetical protein
MIVSAIVLCAIAGSSLADSVSCSGVSKFDPGKYYDKGGHVWTWGGSSTYYLWECDNPETQSGLSKKCHNAPNTSNNQWRKLGTCDKSPS